MNAISDVLLLASAPHDHGALFAWSSRRNPQLAAMELAGCLDQKLGIDEQDDPDAQALYFRIGEEYGGLGESLVADLAWLMDNAQERATADLPYVDAEHYGWVDAERARRSADAPDAVACDWLAMVEPIVAGALMRRVA